MNESLLVCLKELEEKNHQLLPFIATLKSCLIVMEACSGANYWYRQFITLGHKVKLISPQYVK
ncbi:MAG: hypothetical protein K0S11_987 [Gammaproteobacteria bacterium]|jgi:transposase|nr:hypothetical protein [Gammaproteobacteria bacterium]